MFAVFSYYSLNTVLTTAPHSRSTAEAAAVLSTAPERRQLWRLTSSNLHSYFFAWGKIFNSGICIIIILITVIIIVITAEQEFYLDKNLWLVDWCDLSTQQELMCLTKNTCKIKKNKKFHHLKGKYIRTRWTEPSRRSWGWTQTVRFVLT